jgi:hypothetical protein
MCIILFLSHVGFSDAILNNYNKYYEINKLNSIEFESFGLIYTYNFEQGIESGNYDFSSSTDFKMKSLKIGGEFLAGCAGEVLPGGFIALMMAQETSDYYRYGEWDQIHLTNLIGAALLVAPLTWGTGKLLGEDPSFWKTLLGALIGSLAATYLWEADAGDNYSLELYYLFLTPLGACIGANL